DKKCKGIGQHSSSSVKLKNEEEPNFATTVEKFDENIGVVTATKGGQVKQTHLSEFEATRISRPIVNIKLKNDDEVIGISMTETGSESLLFVTEKGLTLKYPVAEVSPTGLKSQGVKAMNVKADDKLVFGELIPEEGNLVTVSNRGAVKRTRLDTLETGARAQVGSMVYRDSK